jgi:hypothetical protein
MNKVPMMVNAIKGYEVSNILNSFVWMIWLVPLPRPSGLIVPNERSIRELIIEGKFHPKKAVMILKRTIIIILIIA